MTLQEKLNDSIITNIDIRESENRMYYEYNHLELAEKCEKIADEFAIGFAKFIDDLIGEYGLLGFSKNFGKKSTEELLEIYKNGK